MQTLSETTQDYLSNNGIFLPEWVGYLITLETKSIYRGYLINLKLNPQAINLSKYVHRSMKTCAASIVAGFLSGEITIDYFKQTYPNLRCETRIFLYRNL